MPRLSRPRRTLNSMYFLALRRWCSSLTLSSPQAFPSLHVLWAFVAGLCALLVLAILFQGPFAALKQVFDLVGHASLVRKAARRVWRASRMVSIAIGFTVVSWTASQAWVFTQESRKADLVMLTKSRGLGELAIEQGMFAALTPLRDVAGLADNLPLLIIAAIMVFRASFELPGWGAPAAGPGWPATRGRGARGWSTLDLGMRRALCALSDRGQDGRQHRSAAGELPGRGGRHDPALDGGLRRHSCWRGS